MIQPDTTARISSLKCEWMLNEMPEVADMEPGVLYVSKAYQVAIHLCACGCGAETVTPLHGSGWTLTGDARPTLTPSIGNWQFPCRSHYYVTDGRIEWL